MKKFIGLKNVQILFVCAFALLNLSMASSVDLLSAEDLELESLDRERGPELSAPLTESPRWESFNEWQCFHGSELQLRCVSLDDGEFQVPNLEVTEAGRLYEFSLNPSRDFDCEKVLEVWKRMVDVETPFCVYSARLQEYSEEQAADLGVNRWTLWIVSRIKSEGSYWVDDPERQEI